MRPCVVWGCAAAWECCGTHQLPRASSQLDDPRACCATTSWDILAEHLRCDDLQLGVAVKLDRSCPRHQTQHARQQRCGADAGLLCCELVQLHQSCPAHHRLLP